MDKFIQHGFPSRLRACWLLVRMAAAMPSWEAGEGFFGAVYSEEGLGGHLVGGDVAGPWLTQTSNLGEGDFELALAGGIPWRGRSGRRR